MTSFARFLASTTVQPSPVRVPAIEPTNFFIAPLLIHGGATTIGFGGRCDKDLVCRGACLSGIVGGAKRRNKRPLWSRWNARYKAGRCPSRQAAAGRAHTSGGTWQ